MGYYTEAGKNLEVFNSRYKVKLLLGMRVKMKLGEESSNDSFIYFCKVHDKIYKIFELFGKIGCSELDPMDTIIPENIFGVGSGEEITVDDLDTMFGDREEFAKRMKTATYENIDKLLEEIPELKPALPDLTMEMFWYSSKTFSQLMQDIQDEYDNATRDEGKKLKNKIDGAFKAYELEKSGVRPTVQRGEIWKSAIPVGIGSVTNGYRYVIIISRDIHARSSRTVNVVNMVSAIDHVTGAKKSIKEGWQLEITNADLQDGVLANDSYINITDLNTLDKLQLETRIGKVKDEFLKEVICRVAKQIAVFDEPEEIEFIFDDEE